MAWGRCTESAAAAPLRPWKAIAAQFDAAITGGSLHAALTQFSDETDDPPSGRMRMHAAAVAALRAAPRTVVVVDDLQWADEASLSLLELLADDLPAFPLLVIATLRTPLVEPSAALVDCRGSFSRSHRFQRIELTGLDIADLEAWIDQAIDGEADDDLAGFVHERTNGNAFFAQEVIALLVAEGRVETPLDRWFRQRCRM